MTATVFPRSRRNLFWGLFFTAPWIVGFLALYAYPIISSFVLSLTQYNLIKPPKFIGFQNYTFLFADRSFWQSVSNTLWFVLLAVPINILFSFAVAFLLNQKLLFRSGLRAIAFIPTVIPTVASAVLWLWIFSPTGLINGILAQAGLSAIPWLSDPQLTKPALAIALLWISGGNIIIFLAALQDVPQQYKEAARIDGANWWAELTHVVIPYVSPAILFTTITGMIYAFQYFTFAYVLMSPPNGPANSTLFYGMLIFQQAFTGFRMGVAAAMASILFIFIAISTWLMFRSSARWVYYEA
jgi:multiple sugar transport system permease protein